VCSARLQDIEVLAANSLIRIDGADGEHRIQLLETVRQFAVARLDRRKAKRVRACHARHYAAVVREATSQIDTPEQRAAFDRLEAERGNIFAAFRWALEARELELALEIVGLPWRFWEARGAAEARELLEHALARSPEPSRAHAHGAFGAGRLALRTGDHDGADELFRDAVQVSATAGDDRTKAVALAGLGWCAMRRGQRDRAAVLCREAVALARTLDDGWALADCLNNLGCAEIERGNFIGCRALHEEALAIRRSLGDHEGVAVSLSNLALAALLASDYTTAETLFEESVTHARGIGDDSLTANAVGNLAEIALIRGDTPRAGALQLEQLALARGRNDVMQVAEAVVGLGSCAAAGGEPVRAARLWGAAEALYEEIGVPVPHNVERKRAPYTRAAQHTLGKKRFAVERERGRAVGWEALVDAVGDREPARVA
jgi:tetratricopeptide (TPR) repeat protein